MPKPFKVTAEKGTKLLGALVSSESETLVTVCCVPNGIPPMFIFQMDRLRPYFLKNRTT